MWHLTWHPGSLVGTSTYGEISLIFHTHWIACQLWCTHCPHTSIWVTIRRTGFPALPSGSLHLWSCSPFFANNLQSNNGYHRFWRLWLISNFCVDNWDLAIHSSGTDVLPCKRRPVHTNYNTAHAGAILDYGLTVFTKLKDILYHKGGILSWTRHGRIKDKTNTLSSHCLIFRVTQVWHVDDFFQSCDDRLVRRQSPGHSGDSEITGYITWCSRFMCANIFSK